MSDPRDWQQLPQDPGTQGWPVPGTDPGTQGWPAAGTDPGTQGWAQPPAPGTQGWQGPPPGAQPWPAPPPPGTQPGARPPDASGTQAWTGQPMPPGPVDTVNPGWQVAGSGGWQRPQELPTLMPPDERRRDPAPSPAPPVRRSSPPMLAPMVALLGLVFVTGGTVLAAQQFDLLGTAAVSTETPDATRDPNATEEPFGTYDPDITDDPNATEEPFPEDTQVPTGPTPAPTAFATPPPSDQASVAGTLLYTRGGDIWQVQGTSSSRLVESGEGDALMPAWSPDGRTIYYIQRRVERGRTPPWGKNTGRADAITHMATDVMSVRANGSSKKRRFQSMHRDGQGFWSTVAIQPEIAPNGTVLLVSDLGEVPSADFRIGGVVLSSMSATGRNLRSLGVASRENNYGDDLGHNDPDLSPNGRRLAFTYADKGGGQGQGTPRIGIIRYPVRGNGKPDLSPKNRPYANPDWSPDGRYLAAERVTPDKRDIVILDPDSFAEVARLTNDGRSFAPVWSPNGDQIAYLRVDGLDVDLRIMTLEQGPTGPTLKLDQAVTVDGDVDPESAPAWFIPEDQRTNVTPAAEPSAAPEGTAPLEGDEAP